MATKYGAVGPAPLIDLFLSVEEGKIQASMQINLFVGTGEIGVTHESQCFQVLSLQ